MQPILFSKNATTFTTNGIGRLDCTECLVTEERNGQYTMELSIAETANHAKEIELSSIIVVKPNNTSALQAFRVYKMTKPINGIFSVLAEHISYQLSYIPVMPFSVQASANAANETLQKMKSPVYCAEDNPFTFWTDADTVNSYAQATPASIRQRLGGVEGSVLDRFGGEYEWDNYTVKLHKNRGVQTPNVILRYGKNITDLNQESYISNTVTGICPYWMDTEGNNLVTLPEKVVESQYADNYPFKRTVTLDMSQDFDEKPTVEQLRTAATAYLGKAGIGIPTVSVKVSFIDLASTEEYKDILSLQNVSLCDVIGVEFEKLGISTTAKVVKTVYDVLTERYNNIEVGSIRTSLASTINDQNSTITSVQSGLSQKFKQFGETVQDDITNATAWLTNSNGYVIAVKNQDGSWKELIFADHNDPTQWHNVLRINENGLGFSSDGGQTYKQAWTLDGKLVIGGTNVPSLTVYTTDAETQTLFKVSRDGIIWNVPNSSMTAEGNLTANNASLSNVSITGGTIRQENQIDQNTTLFLELHNAEIRGGVVNGFEDGAFDFSTRIQNVGRCIGMRSNNAAIITAPELYTAKERNPQTLYKGTDVNVSPNGTTGAVTDLWFEDEEITVIPAGQVMVGIDVDTFGNVTPKYNQSDIKARVKTNMHITRNAVMNGIILV